MPADQPVLEVEGLQVHYGHAHALQFQFQRREVAALLDGGKARGLFLKGAAHRVNLPQALAQNLCHIGAAAGLADHQPGCFEIAQGFAHRRLAGAKLLGNAQFNQALA